MTHAQIVSGNEEDYFDNILNQDENAWIIGQYSTLYWGYNAMTKDNLKRILTGIPDGIYTFGYTHVQWHLQIENKLLINPGSCGLPLDCLPGASYTIIDISNNNWQVLERRVQYDIEKAIDNLLKSELYQKAKVRIYCNSFNPGFLPMISSLLLLSSDSHTKVP